jgi:hypothetical protein
MPTTGRSTSGFTSESQDRSQVLQLLTQLLQVPLTPSPHSMAVARMDFAAAAAAAAAALAAVVAAAAAPPPFEYQFALGRLTLFQFGET